MRRGFSSFHPIVLFLYYGFLIVSFMLYQHPFFQVIGVLLLLLSNSLLDNGLLLKKWLWPITMMSVLIIIFTPLFNRRGNHILFYLFDNQIMLEAVIQGVMIALTLIGILIAFMTCNRVLTAEKILFLFSKWFSKWTLLLMLAIRFVPLLRQRLHEIGEVQEIKGLSINYGTIKERAKNGMLLVQVLLTFSLEESIQTADSMAARGYGLQKRSKYYPYRIEIRDILALAFLIVLQILLLFGWWLGDGVLTLLPVLEPIWLHGREWFYFTIWFLLISFPIFVEGKEVMKWKYYQQKM